MHLAKHAMAAVLLLAVSVASAQTAPSLRWNEDELTWTAPTVCDDAVAATATTPAIPASPITSCPISGYKIETAASISGAFVGLSSPAGGAVGNVLTHKVAGLLAGPHCYRVFALSGTQMSKPSNVACATTVGPAPGAPVLRTIDQVAWDVKRRYWGLFGPYELNARVGTIELGSACARESVEGHNGVDRSDVTFTRPPRSKLVVARCA